MRNVLRVQRQWLDAHRGQALDEQRLPTIAELKAIDPFDPEKRAQVEKYQAEIAKLPQYEFPVRHHFADGVYVRELFIPVNAALVGYIHMQGCVTMLMQGSILINDGKSAQKLSAPMTFICLPGSKKAGFALEATLWLDAYANPDNLTDIDALEARLYASTQEEFVARTHLLKAPV